MTLDLREILRERAEALSDTIRTTLQAGPGADHRTPWRQSGMLSASIDAQVASNGFIVGSSSSVAVAQEFGTSRIAPRPFLAPAAVAATTSIADALGQAAAAQIQAELRRR